ncbi:uncharacterized protein LOC144685360 [Cetorhinus maximus]
MAYSQRSNAWKFMVIVFIFLFCELDVVSGQVRYSIPEELEQGAIIGNIADELGLNIASLLSRKGRLLSDYIKRYLEVNLETGMLFVNERIDRDQLCGPTPTCILSFQIVFENSPEMYRGEVEILDINDNSPSFPESAILLQMAESMAPGSRFPLESALDPDMGTNTVTAYSISPSEHFGLKVKTVDDGPKIVELLLEKPLDRERQSSFQLMLTATDGGSPPRSGTARILITVLDSNDNAPAFDREIYKVSLVENSPRGTLVVSVHATDPDEGPNAEVTYSFSNRVSQKVQELFSLDRRTGEITIQGALDFEEASSYSLDVQAVDNGSPAIAGHSKVLIKVIDVNDNAPEIKVTLVSSKVSEDVARGTVIALINIIDHDSGENGQVHCQIPLDFPFKLQTSLSNRYKLIISGLLDRETAPLYNIPISARDSGSPPLSTNKSIQISVSDINDNAPRFARPMDTAYVMENNAPGASIFTVTASDPDLDQNSYVTYSFTENLIQDYLPSSYLNLNSMNGTIYALRSFDYEQVKNFQIQVQARDAGVPPLSSSVTLNVIILDQNDNAPVIVSPSAQSGSAAAEIVPQSAAQGYMVTKIIATDADSGQNARLLYQVLKATDPSLFNVGLNTGEVRTARAILELDATTQTLVILVKDNGQPSLSSTVTIHFSILGNVTEISAERSNLVTNPEYVSDVNVYLIVILGSTSLIFLVIIILLIGIKCKQDRNLSEDYNSPSCCYRLEDSNDAFNPRPVLTESLNYTGTGEIVRFPETHHYAVCLSPESAKSDFLFLKPYTPPMSQEKYRACCFNRLQAWIWKMIQSRPMANSQRNDALTFKTFAFTFLTCVPDLASGQVRYSIPEELEQDTFVGNIAGDSGLNVRQLSARKFRLASDDGRQYLKVSLDNGILSIRERIDREYICGLAATCILPFKIVTENPFEIYRGEVEILDVNDNSPSFADNTISLQIAETIAPGVRFPLESAQDPDVGINTVAVYTISPNEHFGLKMQTTEDGVKIIELLLEKPLDREQQSSYQLVLSATDGGSPHRSGTVQVLITVLDSNDNPPMFDRAIYRSSLTENAPRGTLVIKVSAHDLDEGPNAEVTYSFSKLASPRVRELFSLDAQTGEIRIEGALDFEETNTYSLDIRAVDNGSPAIVGHSKVLIKVIDVNDNAPEIKVTSVSSMVSEDVQRGTLISLINVIDQDSGENFHCQISKNIPFKLQTSSSNHYKLITSGVLDRETLSMYNILILTTDSGSPPLSTNKTIPISVSDVNDNAPQFSQMLYTVYVMENNSPGASIFAVTALNPDMDQNSFVSYAIMSDMMQDLPVSSFISVNSNNGDIYALRSFDYEQRKNFQIQVQARDAGVPPLSSSATLNVIILDQNDNAPVIVSPSAQSGSAAVEIVPQSAAQGYLVTKIIATDADSGQNARLSYQVLEATDPSLFNVGLNTGEVRTARGISEPDASTESLVILVKDNGQPSLSSTVKILFSILANATEKFPASSSLVRNPEYVTDLNLYLIIALGSTTLIFLVTIIFLIGIKCKQDRSIIEGYNSPICCCKREDSNYSYPERFGPPAPLNYTDAGEIVPNVEPYHYTVCLSPESSKTDFLFLKPYVSPLPQEQC